MTIQTALLQGTQLLETDHIAAPRLTAEVLLSHALVRDRVYLYAHSGRRTDRDQPGSTTAATSTSAPRQAHPIHHRPPGILRPRFPRDTRRPDPAPRNRALCGSKPRAHPPSDRVLDIGTGSGAIAITLALETQADVTATDISPAALCIAQQNSRKLSAKVNFLAADLSTCFADASFDLIASNPPYVPKNRPARSPKRSPRLRARRCAIRRTLRPGILPAANRRRRRVLRPGGWLLLELGYNSLDPVREMFGPGWSEITVKPDLAGFPRVLAAQLWREIYLCVFQFGQIEMSGHRLVPRYVLLLSARPHNFIDLGIISCRNMRHIAR